MVQAVAGILATWVGIDRFGFFENKKIDHELRVRTGAEGELIGFVYRRPTTIYDAHAEIGLLSITEKKILIVTEDETIEINRAEIVEVSREKKHPLHPPARRMARHKTGKQGSLQTRKPEVQFNDA